MSEHEQSGTEEPSGDEPATDVEPDEIEDGRRPPPDDPTDDPASNPPDELEPYRGG
jgi:hypothetical protein